MQRLEDRDALERVARIWEKTADVREHHPELEAGGRNDRFTCVGRLAT